MPDTYQSKDRLQREIVMPEHTPWETAAAASLPDGADRLARQKEALFNFKNGGVHSLQDDIVLGDKDCKRLEKQQNAAEKQVAWTQPNSVVVTSEVVYHVTTFDKALAGVLLGGTGLSLLMSNRIGATYVSQSSVDLYSGDMAGATLYMVVVVIAVLMGKGADLLFNTDAAKLLFARIMFGTGALAFLVWCAATAYVFAPDTSTGAAVIAGNSRGPGHWLTSLLVFTHLIVDATGGYACFWSANKILHAGNKRGLLDNPTHADATARAQEAARQHGERREARNQADDDRQSLADGREVVRLVVQDDCAWTAQVEKLNADAALATARAKNFKQKE